MWRYDVGSEPVGRGAYGEVYRGTQKRCRGRRLCEGARGVVDAVLLYEDDLLERLSRPDGDAAPMMPPPYAAAPRWTRAQRTTRQFAVAAKHVYETVRRDGPEAFDAKWGTLSREHDELLMDERTCSDDEVAVGDDLTRALERVGCDASVLLQPHMADQLPAFYKACGVGDDKEEKSAGEDADGDGGHDEGSGGRAHAAANGSDQERRGPTNDGSEGRLYGSTGMGSDIAYDVSDVTLDDSGLNGVASNSDKGQRVVRAGVALMHSPIAWGRPYRGQVGLGVGGIRTFALLQLTACPSNLTQRTSHAAEEDRLWPHEPHVDVAEVCGAGNLRRLLSPARCYEGSIFAFAAEGCCSDSAKMSERVRKRMEARYRHMDDDVEARHAVWAAYRTIRGTCIEKYDAWRVKRQAGVVAPLVVGDVVRKQVNVLPILPRNKSVRALPALAVECPSAFDAMKGAPVAIKTFSGQGGAGLVAGMRIDALREASVLFCAARSTARSSAYVPQVRGFLCALYSVCVTVWPLCDAAGTRCVWGVCVLGSVLCRSMTCWLKTATFILSCSTSMVARY